VLACGWWLFAARCWLVVAGCWLLDAGRWTLAAGCWMLDAEYWLLVRLLHYAAVEFTFQNSQVNYRETITAKAEFEFTHKKQTGGSGQYAKVNSRLKLKDESIL
jgi:translation elongation factor EF-G